VQAPTLLIEVLNVTNLMITKDGDVHLLAEQATTVED
jgi:hypothetical protein